MRSGNPALNDSTFSEFLGTASSRSNTMTITGTANKTLILVGLAFATSLYTYTTAINGQFDQAIPWAVGGAIVALILGLVTAFKPTAAPITAPLYALAEGLLLGGLSALYEIRYGKLMPGIVVLAVTLTFGTLTALLAAYQFRLIRATENFKLGVFAATGGIGILYLATFILGFFGIQIPYLHSAGPIGIGFSAFVVVVAALNLVLDFDFIENACQQGAPKWMEWYAGYGLMVTLVWLYIEFLRLLAKIAIYTQSSND